MPQKEKTRTLEDIFGKPKGVIAQAPSFIARAGTELFNKQIENISAFARGDISIGAVLQEVPSTTFGFAGGVVTGLKEIIQSPLRFATRTGLSGLEVVTRQPQTFVFESEEAKAFFGADRIETFQEQVTKGRELVRELGGTKQEETAIPISLIVAGGIVDFTGFGGGQKGAIKGIAKSNSPEVIAKILKKINVTDDIIVTASKKLATITDEKQITTALNQIADLQKTTKVTKPIADVPDVAEVFELKEIPDLIETGQRTLRTGKKVDGKAVTDNEKVIIRQEIANRKELLLKNRFITSEEALKLSKEEFVELAEKRELALVSKVGFSNVFEQTNQVIEKMVGSRKPQAVIDFYIKKYPALKGLSFESTGSGKSPFADITVGRGLVRGADDRFVFDKFNWAKVTIRANEDAPPFAIRHEIEHALDILFTKPSKEFTAFTQFRGGERDSFNRFLHKNFQFEFLYKQLRKGVEPKPLARKKIARDIASKELGMQAERVARDLKKLPKGTKRVDTNRFFTAKIVSGGGVEFIERKGKSIEVHPEFDTFVFKDGNVWNVSEGISGAKIAEGVTQKEAIENATKAFTKENIAKGKTIIQRQIGKGEVSPAFTLTKPISEKLPEIKPETIKAIGKQEADLAKERVKQIKEAPAQVRTQTTTEGAIPLGKNVSIDIPKNTFFDKSLRKIQGTRPFTALQETVQNNWTRVKKLMEQEGVVFTDKSNPYQKQQLFHGVVGSMQDDLEKRFLKLNGDIVKFAKASKIEPSIFRKDVNNFLLARHTPERNLALGKPKASGITNAEAENLLKKIGELPYSKEVKEIANQLQEVNNEVLNILLEGEVISKELFETLRQRYPNHVPLQRILETDTDDVMIEILGTKGFKVEGTGIKRAKGSEREIRDIQGNILANYKESIIRAEKNKVNLATVQLARENNFFGGTMQDLKPRAIGKDFKGNIITERIDDPLVLAYREKGQQKYLKIIDPQLSKAFQSVNVEQLPALIRGIAVYTRFVAGLATRFNVEFALGNIIRDTQDLFVNLFSMQGGKSATKAVGRVPKSAGSCSTFTD